MADLVLTPTEVLGSGTQGTAGIALVAGEVVYLDANNKLLKGDALTIAKADVAGICVNNAGIDQPIVYQTGNVIDLGASAALKPGETYVVSPTADGGKIAPIGDLLTAQFTTYLGWALDTQNLRLSIRATGVALG